MFSTRERSPLCPDGTWSSGPRAGSGHELGDCEDRQAGCTEPGTELRGHAVTGEIEDHRDVPGAHHTSRDEGRPAQLRDPERHDGECHHRYARVPAPPEVLIGEEG